jgi:hypothetical protein
MALSFRKIGARLKTQGGTSFNNLAVNKRLSTVDPLVIIGNTTLFITLAKMLQADVSVLQSIATPVEVKVTNEMYDILHIVSLIKEHVISGILSAGTLVNNVISEYLSGASDFSYTGVQLLKDNVCFIEELARNLLSAGVTLLFSNMNTFVRANLTAFLPYKYSFQSSFLDKLVPYIFDSTYFLNYIHGVPTQDVYIRNNYTIDAVYDKQLRRFFTVTLNENGIFKFLLQRSVFTCSPNNLLNKLVITLRNDADLSIVETLFDETFSPGVATTTVDSSFIYTNTTGSSISLVLCVYAEMDFGYVQVSGFISVDVTDLTFEQYLPENDPVALPVESRLPLYIYDANKRLSEIVTSPNMALVEYKRGNPIWKLILQFMINVKSLYVPSFGLYVAANLTGPLTLYTPTLVTNVYKEGSIPIFLSKLKANGDLDWYANVYSQTVSYTNLKGITTDTANSAYLYGTHRGSSLIAYSANGTAFSTIINQTAPTTVNSNVIVIKYSSSGNVSDFARYQSNFDQDINDVYVDDIFGVHVAGSTNSTTKLTIRNFNNNNGSNTGQLTIPIYFKGFVNSLSNVGNSGVEERQFFGLSCVSNTTSPPYTVLPTIACSALRVTVVTNTVVIMYKYALYKFINNVSSTVAFFRSETGLVPADDNVVTTLHTSYNYTDVLQNVFFLFSYSIVNLTLVRYALIKSSSFLDDTQQQMCTSSDTASNYITLRSSSSLNYTQVINSAQTLYPLPLPSNESDATFLIKCAHETNALTGNYYACLTNATVTGMYTKQNIINVQLSFISGCNVYSLQSGILTSFFSIGNDRSSGNAIVQFDATTLVPTLLGYTLGSLQ